jgi:hypothetical protein
MVSMVLHTPHSIDTFLVIQQVQLLANIPHAAHQATFASPMDYVKVKATTSAKRTYSGETAVQTQHGMIPLVQSTAKV